MSSMQPIAAPLPFTLKTKLSVDRVSMVFERDGKRTEVLNNINLEVGDGEFVCLLGPSGCGKTTLLNAMAGFLSPNQRGDQGRRRGWCEGRTRGASSFSRSAGCSRG
jgi:ABC-type taurine transport system ATPase subunit